MAQLTELTPRQRKYIDGRRKGKSKQKAAIDAGYSLQSPPQVIEKSPLVQDRQAQFREQLDRAVPDATIANKLNQLVNAKKIHSSHTEPDRLVDDNPTQLKATELVTKLKGYNSDSSITNVQVNIQNALD